MNQTLLKYILHYTEETEINLKSSFKELHFDSLSLIKFIIELEEKFQILFEDEEVLNFREQTIKETEDMIQIKLKMKNKKNF